MIWIPFGGIRRVYSLLLALVIIYRLPKLLKLM